MLKLLTMGGYGAYVWPAYGMTLLVLSILFISAWREKKRVRQRVAKIQDNA